jgi:hypothetical protein
MLQALVTKRLQWSLKPPSNQQIQRFLSTLGQGRFPETALKKFLDKLAPKEMLAIVSCFVRVCLAAGESVKKAGDRETDLHFVVSGTLKDIAFPSLETKEKIYRKSNISLSDEDFFGTIYPFKDHQTCASDIETVTQVEMVKISRQKLVRLCHQYPNIEMALIDLYKIRSEPEKKIPDKTIRKAERYRLPIKMNLEISPNESSDTPLVIDGYSSDISIGGICVILNGKNEHIDQLLTSLPQAKDNNQIRVNFPSDTMELKVLGSIAWSHKIHFNGSKTLALGIRFEENSPKLRGMLFMLANFLGGTNGSLAL